MASYKGSSVDMSAESVTVETTAGTRAWVTASLRVTVTRDGTSRSFEPQDVRCELRYGPAGWQVWQVSER